MHNPHVSYKDYEENILFCAPLYAELIDMRMASPSAHAAAAPPPPRLLPSSRKPRWRLATSLVLATLFAVTWAASGPVRAAAPLQVSITATPVWPLAGEPATLRADILNAPSESSPSSYRWDLDLGGEWHSIGTDPTLSFASARPAYEVFRVTVTYGSGASVTSAPLTIVWTECGLGPTPEPAPASIRGGKLVHPENLSVDVSSGGAEFPASRNAVTGAISVPTSAPISGGKPGRPENLIVDVSPGELTLSASWDAVVGASSYKLRWRRPAGNFEAESEAVVTATSTTFSVSDYGKWVVRLEGCNDADCGRGVSRTVVIKQVIPTTSQNLAVNVTPGELTLSASWDAVSGASWYKLRWRRPAGNFQAESEAVVTATSTTFSVSDYGKWVVRLEGCNDAGCGRGLSRTALIRQVTTMMPQNFVVNVTPGELTLSASWDAVSDASSYKLRWRRAGEGFQTMNQVVVTDTLATISVPQSGEWVVRLEACGVSGCGQHVSLNTQVSPSVPDTPTNLAVTASSGAPKVSAS